METIAVYPGSFDPVTNGHLDIIERSRSLFSRLVVAIINNPRKEALFSPRERLEMMQRAIGDAPDVDVQTFDGLLVRFATQTGARVIVRGLRAVSDFEYEFQMALMNRQLRADLETIFMVPHESYTFLSSSLIKEIYSLGGTVDDMVPPFVEERLRERFGGEGG